MFDAQVERLAITDRGSRTHLNGVTYENLPDLTFDGAVWVNRSAVSARLDNVRVPGVASGRTVSDRPEFHSWSG